MGCVAAAKCGAWTCKRRREYENLGGGNAQVDLMELIGTKASE
jgi:hypothetical protein